jgi:hypothetical protein
LEDYEGRLGARVQDTQNPLVPLSLTSGEARSLIPLPIWMAEMGQFEKHRSWLVEDEGLLHD